MLADKASHSNRSSCKGLPVPLMNSNNNNTAISTKRYNDIN